MDDGYDAYSMLMGDDATAAEQAAAMARALRGQRQLADFNQQQGVINQFSGDRVLSGVGKSLQADAQQGYSTANAGDAQLNRLGENRLLRQTEASRNAALAQYHQDLVDARKAEEARKAAADVAPKFGLTTSADGLTTAVNLKDPTQTVEVHQATRKLSRGGEGGGAGGAGGGPPPGYTQDQIDHWAAEYNSGKGLPPVKGKIGQALSNAVVKRAYDLDHDASASSNASDFTADTKSLNHFQQQSDAVGGFIKTFDKNTQVLRDAVAQLHSSNSPFLNKGLRFYQSNVEADPALTRFKNALSTVTSEMGKINSGSTGAGGVPISVLQEMEHNLPADATPAQVMAALEIARKDSENRKAAMDEQGAEIRARRDSHRKAGNTATSPAPQAAAPQLQAGEVLMYSRDGKPHAVPAAQVDEAIQHKWRKG